MKLQLKNIGMIKEADVSIDGLTVIAGENDTGKSTVGKALVYINGIQDLYKKCESEVSSEWRHTTQDDFFFNYCTKYERESIPEDCVERYQEFLIEEYLESKDLINDVIIDGYLDELEKYQKNIFHFSFNLESYIDIDDKIKRNIIFIDTPIIANFFDFFSILDTIQNDSEYDLNNYPYLSRALYKQLKLKLKKETTLNIHEQLNILKNIIGGELKTDSMGKLIFNKKDGSEYNINAVATGIKNFGILQLLIKNNYLTKDSILIIDEPEVHLHPKWQLKYAQFIVNLVKNDIKVFVNSHSPYMIEALKRYSEVEEIEDKTNFYLAEDGYIKQIENTNALTLEKIFEKLSEPFDVFDEMDSQRLQNG
jgi:predicted ATPase